MERKRNSKGPVRFAVVGLGHFAQTAILPAFARAKHAKLVALISDDSTKRSTLKKQYGVKDALPYARFEEYLESGAVDAVYIALPNDLHSDYAVRAASHKVHVLCEKPMAVTSQDGQKMIGACKRAKVKLMVAYRLHFDKANLAAVELLKRKKLGEPRYFVSGFSQQVALGNTRVKAERGGGPVYDLGVYCINAARYLFHSDPTEVMAFRTTREGDERFHEVDEQMTVLMRFPKDRLATFVCGFGAAKESFYDVVCTNGRLRLDPAYDHRRPLQLAITGKKGKTKTVDFKHSDQVAAEISYFAECIRRNRAPEPSGEEGLIDVRIIEAIHESAQRNLPISLAPALEHDPKPKARQGRAIPRRAKKPRTVHVKAPSR